MPSAPIPQPGSNPDPQDGSTSDPIRPTPLPPVVPPPVSSNPFGATPGGPLTNAGAGITDSGLTPNVAAVLAVLFPLFTGLIFLFLEKKNRFVRYWAMQSVFFGAAIFVYMVVFRIIGNLLGHILGLLAFLWGGVGLLVSLGILAVWIVMLFKAVSGKEWDVPVIGPVARQQLGNPPFV